MVECELKTCSKCGKEKPLTLEFFYRYKKSKDGFSYNCKVCDRIKSRKYYNNNKDKVNKRHHEYGKHNKDKIKNNHYKYQYGISLTEYRDMYEARNGYCDVCGIYKKVLHVDHDHVNGNIRGLLCNNCNCMLGFSNDNPLILVKATKYLQQSSDF